jgi:hypothetical protein
MAMALPMPLPPPVMMAVLFARRMLGIVLGEKDFYSCITVRYLLELTLACTCARSLVLLSTVTTKLDLRIRLKRCSAINHGSTLKSVVQSSTLIPASA